MMIFPSFSKIKARVPLSSRSLFSAGIPPTLHPSDSGVTVSQVSEFNGGK